MAIGLPIATRPDERDLSREKVFQSTKASMHQELLEAIDLSRIAKIDPETLRKELTGLADALIRRRPQAKDIDKARLVDELMNEFYGLGPLEALLGDDSITDILVNSPSEVYIERQGKLERTGVVFADQAHLVRIIQRVVARSGRRIDESSAMVDARLPDGSRINAVVPPVAVGGPILSIRRFGRESLTVEDMLEFGSMTEPIARFLRAAVAGRASMLISGGTGSGKTTLLGALSGAIAARERVVVIEETSELQLKNRHSARMEARPANVEGQGQVTLRDLVRNALRMRPDRIVVGEVRGPEAFDMLQAMNTGHEGSLTTIHANDAYDALLRLEMMVALTGLELPLTVVRQYVAMAIRLVVHLSRLPGGARKISRVSELVGLKDGMYELRDLFVFETQGVDPNGSVVGEFHTSGYRPQLLDRLHRAGVDVDPRIFDAM